MNIENKIIELSHRSDFITYFVIILSGIILFTMTYFISIYVFEYKGSLIENLAVLTSYICTLLVVFEKRLNFIFAIISTFLFSILFFEQNLFGSAVMNVYFLYISTWGYISWKYKKIDLKISINSMSIYIIISIALFLLCYFTFTHFNGKMVFWDTVILFLSILANLLMVNKKIHHWFVWIIVNIISIYVYYKAGLFNVMLQYSYFLVNAFIGIYFWNKLSKDKR